MQTRITQLLDIQYPIVLPGMSWIADANLVAAVCNAGGLGILATGTLSPAQTKHAIAEIRSLTDKPFGVGCTLLMPGALENAQQAIAEKVPVINFSLGKGDWLVEQCHQYGGKVIATVTTIKHALAAQKAGVDALMVTGHEAAAHGGDVTSLVLVPAIAKVVDLPLIATGGFATGNGLLAALALGADAVAMGTRLATSQESPMHHNIKQAVIEKTQEQTIYSPNFDGIPARYMHTPLAVKLNKKPMNFLLAAVHALRSAKLVDQPLHKIFLGLFLAPKKVKLLAYFGAALPKLKSATVAGDLDNGMQFVGQSQGLIDSQEKVEVIIKTTVADAKKQLNKINSLF